MSVSYLITLYNKEEFVGPVMDAVLAELAETGGEVIVYDDASTDHSFEIAQQRIEAVGNQSARIERGEVNRGVGAGTNYLIRLASRPYTRLIDGDDLVVRGSTAQMLRLMKEQDLQFIFGQTTEIGNKDRDLERQTYKNFSILPRPLRAFLRRTIAGTSPSLFDTERLKQACPIPDYIRRTQDFMLILRLVSREIRIGYVDDIVSVGPANRTSNNMSAALAAMFAEMSRDVAHEGNNLPLDDLRYVSRRYAGRAEKYFRRQGKSYLSAKEKFELWHYRYLAWFSARQTCIARLRRIADFLDRDRDVFVTGRAW